MNRWVRLVAIVTLIWGCFAFIAQPQAQAVNLNGVILQSSPVLAVEADRRNAADDLLGTEFGKKLDLNNSDIRDFRDLRGFYPTLAGKIIKNAPYEKVEDVLKIPSLSERQKERLQANLDNFTVNPPQSVFNEGDDRFNIGVY